MVYSVILRSLSFKMDISITSQMLANQQATYAILRYAKDIPDKVYKQAMALLNDREGFVHYVKLRKLIDEYNKASKPIIEFEEDELVETIIVGVGYTETDDIMVDYDAD